MGPTGSLLSVFCIAFSEHCTSCLVGDKDSNHDSWLPQKYILLSYHCKVEKSRSWTAVRFDTICPTKSQQVTQAPRAKLTDCFQSTTFPSLVTSPPPLPEFLSLSHHYFFSVVLLCKARSIDKITQNVWGVFFPV